jgi:hypothetical protein
MVVFVQDWMCVIFNDNFPLKVLVVMIPRQGKLAKNKNRVLQQPIKFGINVFPLIIQAVLHMLRLLSIAVMVKFLV